MKHDISLQELTSFIGKQGIVLSGTQVEQLELYHRQLQLWNRKHNLVSKSDESFLIFRHFLPSFLYVYFLMQDGFSINQKLTDIGSGGGFPGIIISICFPDRKIVLIESIRKKMLFLKTVSQKLNLNMEVVLGRIEEQENEKYNIITARAVASLDILDEYGKHLLLNGGRLYTIKSCDYEKEIDNQLSLSIESREIPEEWEMFSEKLINRKMIVLKK